jgi:diguanylate cyclase
VPSSTRAAIHSWLVWAMGLFLAAHVAGLALQGLGWGPPGEGWLNALVSNWLEVLSDWAPAAVCWLAVYQVGLRCPEVLLAAAAVTSYAVADTLFVLLTAPELSLADVGYLSFYPLMLAPATAP